MKVTLTEKSKEQRHGGLLRSEDAAGCKCLSPQRMKFLWVSLPVHVFIPAGNEERDVEQTPEWQLSDFSKVFLMRYFQASEVKG